LQSSLRLNDVRLLRCEADGAGPPIRTTDPVRLSAELDSELEEGAAAGLEFAVTLRVACHDALTFHINATFLVQYSLTNGINPSKSEVDAFRKSYAVLAAWPYVREFVQSLASRMGFPIEPLPMVRLALRSKMRRP